MPAKPKRTNRKLKEEPILFDPPATNAQPDAFEQAVNEDVRPPEPMMAEPMFAFTKGGHVTFQEPVKEFVRFGELLLVRLGNEDMLLSTDGKIWRRFVFEIRDIEEINSATN